MLSPLFKVNPDDNEDECTLIFSRSFWLFYCAVQAEEDTMQIHGPKCDANGF
jgi:hypothetical protein